FAWLAFRATLLAIFAGALVVWIGRRHARSAVIVAAAAMITMSALPILGLCPLPESAHWTLVPLLSQRHESGTPEAASPEAEREEAQNRHGMAVDLMRLLSLMHASAAQTSSGHVIWAAVGIAYVVGLGFAILRLLIGWLSICRLRKQARLI